MINQRTQFVFIILLLSTMLYGCQNVPSEEVNGMGIGNGYSMEEVPTTFTISQYGKCFIQPLDTLTSLNMAGVRAYFLIDFIDSEYCTVLIYSASGDVRADRRYKILDEENKIVFINSSGELKEYRITGNQLGAYITSEDGVKWKVMPSFNDIQTQNSMKRDAFLYPVLTEEERQFGAEDRVVVDDKGQFTSKSHPLRREVSKINLFKLF